MNKKSFKETNLLGGFVEQTTWEKQRKFSLLTQFSTTFLANFGKINI